MSDNLNGTPLLSVIVPVCNVEQFLDECMTSIQEQDVKDIEVICINDGSTDSSLEILQRYASNDPRIKVIDKENAGYGAAMNDGLDVATGKYLAILESDDFVAKDGWATLLELCQKKDLDVAKGCYWRHSDTDEFFKVYDQVDTHCPPALGAIPVNEVFDPENALRVFWMTPSIWSCVYDRSFLEEHGIRFNETPGASFQDTGFFFEVWSSAKRAMIVDDPVLYYRVDNSGSSSKSTKKVHAVREEMDFIDRFLKSQDSEMAFRQVFSSIRYKTYLWNMHRISDDYIDEFEKAMNADLLGDFKNGYFTESMFNKRDGKDYMARIIKTEGQMGDNGIEGESVPAVSIIVPIYNVSDYLEQCLSSIVNQTLKNIEIICVNDGSTDNSPEIIAKFAENDARIKVINKANAGYGAAMNDGLKAATGKYIGIVEPDDYIDAEMFETLYNAATSTGEEYDLVRSGWREFSDEDESEERIRDPFTEVELGRPVNLDDYFDVLVIHPSIWSAIYKKSFLDEFDIRFKEIPGAGWVDNPFFIQTMYFARTPVFISGHFYNYRVANEASSSFLRDATLPFTRLTEMLDFIDTQEERVTFRKAVLRRGFPYYRISMNAYPYAEQSEDVHKLFKDFFSRIPDDLFDDVCFDEVEKRDVIAFTEGFHVRPASKDPQVSIVIPCLDSARYVNECVDSLKSQTFDDIEVIFVDQGSSDYTRTRLYARTMDDDRMTVIVEKGADAGRARNIGMEAASGKYIAFLDIASVYEPTMVEECWNACEKGHADIAVFGTDLYYERSNKFKPDPKLDLDIFPDNETFDLVDANSPTVFIDIKRLTWNKFFRSSFLASNEIKFQEIGAYGDILFTYSAFVSADAITVCDKILAHEHHGRGHSLLVAERRHWRSAEDALLSLRSMLDSKGVYGDYEPAFKNYALHVFATESQDLHADKDIAKFYHAVKDEWVDRFSLREPQAYYCIKEDSKWLERLLDNSVEDILVDELLKEVDKRRRAFKERRIARDELKATKADNRKLKKIISASTRKAGKAKTSKKEKVKGRLSKMLHK